MIKRSTIQTIAVAFITLLMVSLLLFYARKACQNAYYRNVVLSVWEYRAKAINIQLPTHLDPNNTVPLSPGPTASLAAPNHTVSLTMGLTMYDQLMFSTMGFHHDFNKMPRNKLFLNRYTNSRQHGKRYYDKHLDLFVDRSWNKQDRQWIENKATYIGPLGNSDTPEESVGQFSTSLITVSKITSDAILYDNQSRCFYHIDLFEKTVRKGPELPTDIEPVQLGPLLKHVGAKLYAKRVQTGLGSDSFPIGWKDGVQLSAIPVLDNEDTIQWLNISTLQLGKPYYHLGPTDDLISYQVRPINLYRATNKGAPIYPTKPAGYSVVTIDRKFRTNAMVMNINNKRVGSLAIEGLTQKSEEYPFGPLYTVTRYLLESLQGPALHIAAFYGNEHMDAVAGERALFILPNSLTGTLAYDLRDKKGWQSSILRVTLLTLIMLPSLLLSIILAWRINRNAKLIGLTLRQRRLWIIATLLLGLSVYIAYRIMRPRNAVVTCSNCGNMRRVDYDTCHNCQATWQQAEKQPPAWRITA